MNKTGGGGNGLDKGKVLKVSWEKTGLDYMGVRLKEIFEKFGPVDNVVIKSSKKKGSALVVMMSKEAAVSFKNNMECSFVGNLSFVVLLGFLRCLYFVCWQVASLECVG